MTPTVIRSQLHNSSNNNNNCQSSPASPVVVMVSNTNSKKLGNLPESGLLPSTVGALSSSSQQLSSNKGMVPNPETTTVSKSDRTDVSNNLNCVSDASWNNMSSSLKVTEERNKVLMNVCFKTLELTAKNRQLQKELADLKVSIVAIHIINFIPDMFGISSLSISSLFASPSHRSIFVVVRSVLFTGSFWKCI